MYCFLLHSLNYNSVVCSPAIVWGVLVLVQVVQGLDNGHDLPALGWSSWNHFAGAVNETILMDAADQMVQLGLRYAVFCCLCCHGIVVFALMARHHPT